MFGCQRQPLLKSAMINEPATEWIGGSQEVAGVAPETPPQHSGRQLGEASIAGPPPRPGGRSQTGRSTECAISGRGWSIGCQDGRED